MSNPKILIDFDAGFKKVLKTWAASFVFLVCLSISWFGIKQAHDTTGFVFTILFGVILGALTLLDAALSLLLVMNCVAIVKSIFPDPLSEQNRIIKILGAFVVGYLLMLLTMSGSSLLLLIVSISDAWVWGLILFLVLWIFSVLRIALWLIFKKFKSICSL